MSQLQTAPVQTVTPPPATSRVRSIFKDLALVPVIVLVAIYGAVFVPNFATPTNIVSNILSVSAVLGVAVVAQSIVLIGGYFDLSAQSTIGLAPMFGVWLYTAEGGLGIITNPWLAVLIILALGAAIGAFNGLLVGRLGMNAFIVTLAMLILLQGFTLGISGGQTFTDLPSTIAVFGFIDVLGIPLDVLVFILVVVMAAVFMRYHPTGRRIYAMGGNKDAARAAGVNTLRLTIGLFVFSGIMAAFAGMMLSARIASVTASQGENIIFTVFAAAVIGGISLDGGRGTIIGAATGVLLLGMIQNILVLSNVPSFWIDATYGAIILGALLIGSTQVRGLFTRTGRKNH
jgi:simple sugar transport system permease protein